jgi:hypothetical protein
MRMPQSAAAAVTQPRASPAQTVLMVSPAFSFDRAGGTDKGKYIDKRRQQMTP